MLEKLVAVIIDTAKELGLQELDLNNAKEFLDNMEYGLAFDTIVTQLYEYETEINNEFYELLIRVAHKMKISEETYSFMKELVRTEKVIPKPVQDRLTELLKILESNK